MNRQWKHQVHCFSLQLSMEIQETVPRLEAHPSAFRKLQWMTPLWRTTTTTAARSRWGTVALRPRMQRTSPARHMVCMYLFIFSLFRQIIGQMLFLTRCNYICPKCMTCTVIAARVFLLLRFFFTCASMFLKYEKRANMADRVKLSLRVCWATNFSWTRFIEKSHIRPNLFC